MLLSLIRMIQAFRDYQRNVSELSQLSDRELADIGLCRGDISFAIREVAHGVPPEINGEMRPVSAANQNMRRAA